MTAATYCCGHCGKPATGDPHHCGGRVQMGASGFDLYVTVDGVKVQYHFTSEERPWDLVTVDEEASAAHLALARRWLAVTSGGESLKTAGAACAALLAVVILWVGVGTVGVLRGELRSGVLPVSSVAPTGADNVVLP